MFSLKCPPRDVKKEKRDRWMDGWVESLVGNVLFWPPLNIDVFNRPTNSSLIFLFRFFVFFLLFLSIPILG